MSTDEEQPSPTPPTDLSRRLAEVEEYRKANPGGIPDIVSQLAAIVAQLQREREEAERWTQTLINQADRNQLARDEARLKRSDEESQLITTLRAQLSAAQQRVEELEDVLRHISQCPFPTDPEAAADIQRTAEKALKEETEL